MPENRWARLQRELNGALPDCTCYSPDAVNPAFRCLLSEVPHNHPGDTCPVHPNAPGEY